MSERRGVIFGALAPKLHEQVPLSRRRLRYLQECADGVVALAVGGFLRDTEVRRIRQKIVKRIQEIAQGD